MDNLTLLRSHISQLTNNQGKMNPIAVAAAVIALIFVFFPVPKPKPNGDKKFYSKPPQTALAVTLFNALDRKIQYFFGRRIIKTNTEELLKLADQVPNNTEFFGNQDELKVGIVKFGKGLEESGVTGFGMFANNRYRRINLEKRNQAMMYIIKNPSIVDIPIRKPIIITGMMRTGSTLLFNLLNQDPDTRSPFLWEMAGVNPDPTPPPKSKDDPRLKIVSENLKVMSKFIPSIFSESAKTHFTGAEEIEECLFILVHQYFHQLLAPLGGKEFIDWFLKEEGKKYGYTYLKRYLQMLSSGYAPKSHWTLKAPIHALYIKDLLTTFPDACVVFTHRNPAEVVPSTCRLVEMACYFHYPENSLDLRVVGSYALKMSELMVYRTMEFRETHKNPNQFFDVAYTELVKDPIAMVKKIYQHYNINYSEEFERRMKKYIADNPQGKHGRHKYDLDTFGLSQEEISKVFSGYLQKHQM